MCNLGEMIARENIEKGHSMGLEQGLVQGQKLERIASIKNLMKKIEVYHFNYQPFKSRAQGGM